MKRVPRENEPLSELGGPAGIDEFEVTVLIRSVNLVTEYAMAALRQMHPDLVRATCLRKCADQGELGAVARFAAESALDDEPRLRGKPGGMHALLQ